jgi:hypothetical protein
MSGLCGFVSAAETIFMQSHQIKVMHALAALPPDADVSKISVVDLRDGPRVAADLPMVFGFGVDGCFSGVYSASAVNAVQFECLVPSDVWGLNDLVEESHPGVALEAFGLSSDQPNVLILAPSFLGGRCKACEAVQEQLESSDAIRQRGALVTVVDLRL